MKTHIAALLVLAMGILKAEETPEFRIEPGDIRNAVLDAIIGDPWIFSVTLTEKSLADYAPFTTSHLGAQAPLIIAGVEMHKGKIGNVVDEYPVTFRFYAKDEFLAILAALPEFPEERAE